MAARSGCRPRCEVIDAPVCWSTERTARRSNHRRFQGPQEARQQGRWEIHQAVVGPAAMERTLKVLLKLGLSKKHAFYAAYWIYMSPIYADMSERDMDGPGSIEEPDWTKLLLTDKKQFDFEEMGNRAATVCTSVQPGTYSMSDFDSIRRPMFTQTKTSEFDHFAEREIELVERRRGKGAELARAETFFDDDQVAAAIRIRSEIAGIDQTVSAVRRARPNAIRAGFRAEAERLKVEAGAKDKELAVLEAKTSTLLASLSDLEGVAFEETILSAQPARAIGTGYAIPRSARLRAEVSHLAQKAADFEGQDVPASGGVELEDVTDDFQIVLAVLKDRTQAPDAAAVESWLGEVAANAAQSGRKPEALWTRIYLQWRDGVIDCRASYAFDATLTRTNHPYGPIASATFKAER
jgi:hypothetical protein